jgi:hypothetical protein
MASCSGDVIEWPLLPPTVPAAIWYLSKFYVLRSPSLGYPFCTVCLPCHYQLSQLFQQRIKFGQQRGWAFFPGTQYSHSFACPYDFKDLSS